MVMLTDLDVVLERVGLEVIPVPGWKTRARPASSGGFDPEGNGWHHTGAKDVNPESIVDDLEYAEWLARIGRADLAAPLCQLSPGRDGQIYLCAAGRGNHMGTAKAQPGIRAGDGNELYLGWECQNTGSEGWPRAQYAAMVLGGAVTSLAYGWGAPQNRAHRETSVTGKWDPGLLNMDKFRDDIAETMKDLKRRPPIRPTLVALTAAAKQADDDGYDKLADRIRSVREEARANHAHKAKA